MVDSVWCLFVLTRYAWAPILCRRWMPRAERNIQSSVQRPTAFVAQAQRCGRAPSDSWAADFRRQSQQIGQDPREAWERGPRTSGEGPRRGTAMIERARMEIAAEAGRTGRGPPESWSSALAAASRLVQQRLDSRGPNRKMIEGLTE